LLGAAAVLTVLAISLIIPTPVCALSPFGVGARRRDALFAVPLRAASRDLTAVRCRDGVGWVCSGVRPSAASDGWCASA
jgi:hypothetical protein